MLNNKRMIKFYNYINHLLDTAQIISENLPSWDWNSNTMQFEVYETSSNDLQCITSNIALNGQSLESYKYVSTEGI